MVSPIARMRAFRGRIALVRNGFGAAIFPPNVSRLALHFAQKDHFGPRRFWRVIMPRLKYHNPNVQMDVERPQEWGGEAKLTIEFDDGTLSKVIDILDKDEKDIARMVIRATGAEELPINDADSRLANEYLQHKVQKKDSEKAKIQRREQKKEEALLPGMSEVA